MLVSLFIDFWASLHTGSSDELSAFLFQLAYEALVSYAYDKLLIE